MEVRAIVTKKFREPVDTPCFKKVDGGKSGYSKLETSEEIQACFNGSIKCYKKVKDGLFKSKYVEGKKGVLKLEVVEEICRGRTF